MAARKVRSMRLLVLLEVAAAAQTVAAVAPTVVLYNASIHTSMVTNDSTREALCMAGDSIVAVGSHAAVGRACPGARDSVDLGGATVLPGLTDSHCHVMMEAARRRHADLSDCSDATSCASTMKSWGAAHPSAKWLLGNGFDQTSWPGGAWPTREALDAAVGDRPTHVDHVSGHACWVNSAALASANITALTPDPAGGTIVRGSDGRTPTGILTDTAMLLVESRIPPPTPEALAASVTSTFDSIAAHGLTGVHDMAALPGDLAYYAALEASGRLTVRLNVFLDAAAHGFDPPSLPWPGESPMIRARGAKFFADGAMGSWTAAMLAPYSDRENATGTLVYADDALAGNVSRWKAAGYQVATHAIGDAANRQVLGVYESLGARPRDRFRVEHAQILDAADVPRFAAMGVVPAMQPSHVASDLGYADARLGDRVNGAYAWADLLASGVAALPFGSDFPTAGTVPPLLGVHAAATRERSDGTPAGGWRPDQRVSARRALRGYTADAAYAAFRERDLGRIAPGYKADLTVLDADPTAADPAALLGIVTVGTIVAGEVVYAPADSPLARLRRAEAAGAIVAGAAALDAARAWERKFVEDYAEDARHAAR